MLMNNLDPDVAERPDDLVVYGGSGQAARDRGQAFDAIVAHAAGRSATTRRCSSSPGKPVGVFRTHVGAPGAHRQLAAGAGLGHAGGVRGASRPPGLTMYGQMTAGQLDLHRHAGDPAGDLRDLRRHRPRRASAARWRARLTLTAGLGGMGGAQPLAVTMNGGVALCVDVDPTRIQRRLETRYLDVVGVRPRRGPGAWLAGGLAGPPAPVGRRRRQRRRGAARTGPARRPRRHRHRPDPGPRSPCGTCRRACTWPRRPRCAGPDPADYVARVRATMAAHVEAHAGLPRARGPRSSTTATACGPRPGAGVERAFDYPGFVPAYIRPLFCEGKGPFRWAALSGDPADIGVTDRGGAIEAFPRNEPLVRWLRLAGDKVAFQGLPARICWLGYGERDRLGLAFNELVAAGQLRRADRDRARPPRLGLGGLALPRDRGDGRRQRRHRRLADPQRPAQRGQRRAWVSVHHGGGVGIGRSLHAGTVAVADGTDWPPRSSSGS